MMPSWSLLSSSSAAEHSMPFDSTPRITPLASVIFLPGIYVPTGEKTPFIPLRAFGAPQTTCTGPPPASTMQTLSRSASGCRLASITRATTKPSYLALGSSTLSTSSPTRVSVSISASGAEVSRWSLSQESVNFIVSFHQFGSRRQARRQRRTRPAVRGSPAQAPRQGRDVERLEAVVVDPAKVRVEEIAQVGDPVLEHGDAVDPQPPGEALEDLRIDAAIPEHVGMDHPAAQNLEPVLALAEADFSA